MIIFFSKMQEDEIVPQKDTLKSDNIFDNNKYNCETSEIYPSQQSYILNLAQGFNKQALYNYIIDPIEETKEEIIDKTNKIAGGIILSYVEQDLLFSDYFLKTGVGELFDLGSTQNLKNKFNDINLHKNGIRLDNSLEKWKIKAKDKEIKILTDNNIVSEEWSKRTGKMPQMKLFKL